MIALDPARAATDFADPRWLSAANRNTHVIVEACNHAGIPLPATLVRTLLEHSLPLAVGSRCYPHQYVVAAALKSLALTSGEQARPFLESSLDSDQPEIQEAAAQGLVELAGLHDPVAFAMARVDEAGFEGLTRAQRVVYCAFEFEAEVCNGGLMQFFGNSSGNHVFETLEAIRELGHPEAEHALASAMALVGPLAREPDREMRLAAFEDRYDELQTAFKPLQSAYYGVQGKLKQKMLLYAVRHREDFGAAHQPRPDHPNPA